MCRKTGAILSENEAWGRSTEELRNMSRNLIYGKPKNGSETFAQRPSVPPASLQKMPTATVLREHDPSSLDHASSRTWAQKFPGESCRPSGLAPETRCRAKSGPLTAITLYGCDWGACFFAFHPSHAAAHTQTPQFQTFAFTADDCRHSDGSPRAW